MEVNVREARAQISTLLDRIKNGEEITIVRRGKQVARLVPVDPAPRTLPDMRAFRDSITIKGKPLSQILLQGRNEDRY
jgi:prevent-host-death family protein